MRGRIFNIQRFSLQDGPGLRTTVFLKGCPLSCGWCHNPESQAFEIERITQENRCLQCGSCLEVCESKGARCVRCGACVAVCPTGARQWVGRDLEAEALVQELLRDRVFFEESQGGVTFSGGEPLLQSGFVAEVMMALRAEGIHIALDTCGFGRREDLLGLAEGSNLILFDLKLLDPVRHEAATGESSEPILANLEAISRVHRNIWIRVPILPGINDDEDNLEATARLAAATPGVTRLDLLPFHAHGIDKFARLGRTCGLQPLVPPTTERLQALAETMSQHGIRVSIGGRA